MNRTDCVKIVICILFSLSFHRICAQQQVAIAWDTPQSIFFNGSRKQVLHFTDANYFYKYSGLPSYQFKVFDQKVNKVKITNTIWVAINEIEKDLLKSESLADSVVAHIEIAYQNKKPLSIINILPLRYNKATKVFEKLLTFSYTYTTLAKVKQPTLAPITTNPFARIGAYSTTSVLAKGDWYKLKISSTPTTTGSNIYKIDYNLLSSMGIDAGKVDPRKIGLFGNGGGMLPEGNSDFKHDDLQENAIFIEGESDGKFDQGDYILFYGQGPDTWKYDSLDEKFHHIKNVYSDDAYYFLKVKDSGGKRIPDAATLAPSGNVVTTYPAHQFYEKDEFNILKSGKKWYGDKFEAELSRTYKFSLAGAIPGSVVSVRCALMAVSPSPSMFQITYKDSIIETYSISAINPDYGNKGEESIKDIKIKLPPVLPANLELTVTYKKSAASSVGYLNYFELNLTNKIELNGNQLDFRITPQPEGLIHLIVDKATQDVKIWDITNSLEVKNQLFQLDGTVAKLATGILKQKNFIAWRGNDFVKPVFDGKVVNQDLHAIANEDLPDLVIVTSPVIEAQAKKLAAFRVSHDKMKVAVVTTNQVYNEFSSGAQDLVAIRNFMKLLYDKGTGSDSVKYLLLFGSASYDYKDRIKDKGNLVPIFETIESLHSVDSQSSDDYCGFLDDNEGVLESNTSHILDIGIGRLPVRNGEEADKVVDKVIHYSDSPAALGKWRNRVTLVADNIEPGLVSYKEGGEDMEYIFKPLAPSINATKLYLDGFPLVSSPSGQESPAIKESLFKDINKGTLIVNYYGHGSEYIWAQENILQKSELINLSNLDRLPFFVTATCDFGRYDSPEEESGAQSLVLNPDGGSIGIFTSTRPVYAPSNAFINSAFYKAVFNFQNNLKPALGDVIRKTKNLGSQGRLNWNYSLLGDPSMTLAYPQQDIVITSFNNKEINTLDTIRALSEVSMGGEIRDKGNLNTQFNGTVYLTIYDKESLITIAPSARWEAPISYNSRTNIIFEGTASVSAGKFSLRFVVPKDISYNYGQGKISMYAADSNNVDASGYYNQIVIGGSKPNAARDNTPPQINLYMNDTTFKNGGITGSEPVLIAKLYDENGINISSTGIGHEITGILNDSKEVIVMNDYYSAETDDYTNGQVTYPLSQLAPGTYTIRFKVWDTNNNSSESSITFVVKDKEFYISKPYNVPNPFMNQTAFEFEHNRAGEDLEVNIQVYSMTGQPVKQVDKQVQNASTLVSLDWDGRDDSGNILAPALYIYKLKVKALKDKAEATHHSKLIVEN